MTSMNGTSQYLTFFFAGEEYAIPILRVREIIEYSRLTRVPSTPEYIRGVINLRGSVVPVLDLAVKFGFAASAITKTTCIVVVELTLEGMPTVMGVMADAVRQVFDLSPDDIQPVPAFGTLARAELLNGMGVVGDQFVLLLDIDKVVSADELAAEARTDDAVLTEPAMLAEHEAAQA